MIDVTECPYYLITRASLACTARLKEALAAAGVGNIRPAYLGVLMSLWSDDGLRAVELGRRAGLEPSTMTGLLDRMERDGLVVRTPDPEDRRAQRIQLTDAGRQAKRVVGTVVTQALDQMLAGVPERDLSRLKETLRRVLANTHRLEQP